MLESRIIRDRRRPPHGRIVACVLALTASATSFACELVIGDKPAQNLQGSGGSGGESETSAGTGGAPGSGGIAPATGGMVGEGGVISVSSTGGGPTSVPDSGSHVGLGGTGGQDTADASKPDAHTGTGGAPSCMAPVTWYRDQDRDGFGTDDSRYTCPAPAGTWALTSGDCDDDDPNVHPGQTKYFGTPYKKSDNTDSFDYDCSGLEDPNPSLTLAPANCGVLQLALCSNASGYETNNRVGPGINAWCGSTTVQSCVPSALICAVTEKANQPPYSCR